MRKKKKVKRSKVYETIEDFSNGDVKEKKEIPTLLLKQKKIILPEGRG
jgi:hypothetical protein